MRKRAGSGVSGEPESRAMVDPFETGEWWFFNVFHGILLLGIYDEKYVRIFLFDHVPIEWLEMVDGWSGLLLVILVWLISTRKWVITQVASRPSRVTRPYLTHLGWNRFLQPQLLKSGNIQVKRHWTFIIIITSCQKLPKYENQQQISGHLIFWGHFSIFLLASRLQPFHPNPLPWCKAGTGPKEKYLASSSKARIPERPAKALNNSHGSHGGGG